MAPELGGSQLSALLESVPGIRSVLRSPVADALVGVVRAGARISDFKLADVRELLQYAVRRGLISADEGDRLLAEVEQVAARRTKTHRTKQARPRAAPRLKQARPKKRAARGKAPTRQKPRSAKKRR